MTDRIGGFDKKLGHTRTNTDDTKLESRRRERTRSASRPATRGRRTLNGTVFLPPSSCPSSAGRRRVFLPPPGCPPSARRKKKNRQRREVGIVPRRRALDRLIFLPPSARRKKKNRQRREVWIVPSSQRLGPLDIPPTADFDVKTGVAGEVHVVELETIETVQIETQPLRKEPAISPLPLTTLNTEKQSRSQGDQLPQVGVESEIKTVRPSTPRYLTRKSPRPGGHKRRGSDRQGGNEKVPKEKGKLTHKRYVTDLSSFGGGSSGSAPMIIDDRKPGTPRGTPRHSASPGVAKKPKPLPALPLGSPRSGVHKAGKPLPTPPGTPRTEPREKPPAPPSSEKRPDHQGVPPPPTPPQEEGNP